MEKGKVVLDLSKWNMISDYAKLVDGVSGVILRIGYRSLAAGKITEDPKYTTHLNGLKKTKTPVGVYFFTTAITEAEAREEAEWVVKRIKKDNLKLGFPIAVDTEYSNGNKNGRSDKLDKDTRTKCVVAFCERVEQLGYPSMIYASDDWFVSMLNYEDVKSQAKWVARYSTKAPEKAKDNIIGWQCTDAYPRLGTNKGVDMSWWYGLINGLTEVKEDTNILVLKNEPLYSTSTSSKAIKNITGTYYRWDDQARNGKIRITTKKQYIGIAGMVTGWITER